jgi:hypothetical protein
MTPFEKVLEFLAKGWRLDIWILAKVGVSIFLILYVMFALVVARQVSLMCKTVSGLMDKGLIWASRILVALAIGVLLLGLIIL